MATVLLYRNTDIRNQCRVAWDKNPYYTKRFYSAMNMCSKDNGNKTVEFYYKGSMVKYNVSDKAYNNVKKLLHKAFVDGVDFRTDLNCL